jgi:hypothetical protein
MAQRLAALINQYSIIEELIINFDQTAVHIVPKSKTTYAHHADQCVALLGAEDKRQVTALIASSYNGTLLPVQMVFAGKTKACHPSHTADSKSYGFHFTHSENHWSNLDTMKEYLECIIQPYIENVVKDKHLNPTTTRAIIMLDCWNVHLSPEFRDIVKQYNKSNPTNLLLVYIPPNCTSQLQVADVALNYSFKCGIRNRFEDWATKQLMDQLEDEKTVPAVDTKLSTLKPLLVQWAFSSWFNLLNRPDLIKKGWKHCISSILDPFDAKVRADAAQKVLENQLKAYGYVPKEPEKTEYNSDSDTDSDKDELDVLKQRVEGIRKSTRGRKPEKQRPGSFVISSNQMQFEGESDQEFLV